MTCLPGGQTQAERQWRNCAVGTALNGGQGAMHHLQTQLQCFAPQGHRSWQPLKGQNMHSHGSSASARPQPQQLKALMRQLLDRAGYAV